MDWKVVVMSTIKEVYSKYSTIMTIGMLLLMSLSAFVSSFFAFPTFIFFIVMSLKRGNLKCPACNELVKKKYDWNLPKNCNSCGKSFEEE